MDWHALNGEEVLSDLKSSKKGLSPNEVQKRYAQYGKNEISVSKKKSKFRIFLGQFNSLLIYILIAASIISFFIGHIIDAVVILIIVIINGSIGFIQEYKADEIIEKLKKSLNYRALVIRQGEQVEVDSREIVPGDIILFESGSRVLADCRIVNSENLQTNESALTGESFPVDKINNSLAKNTPLADMNNMMFAGTSVVKGKAMAVVVSTGNNTEFGKLADLVRETEDEKMPLEKKIDTFSRNIAIAVLGFVAFVFFLGIYLGFEVVEMFMISVSLAIGTIPEGLPAIIAITLAVAIKQMYKVNTLIRKLPAAETLGRATVICTDKTGTLTEESLTVDKVYVGKEEKLGEAKVNFHLKQLAKIGILCNNARDKGEAREKGVPSGEGNVFGDPTEVALIKFANRIGMSKKEFTEENNRVKEYSFDSNRKMMSIIRTDGKINTSYVKGASLMILDRCTKELVGNKIKLLDKKRKSELTHVARKMESEGLRVLGLAFRRLTKIDQSNAENNLIFTGFVGMIDPPRMEVKQAIKEAQEAGIKIKIITGDSALTTQAIAGKLGLKGDIIEGRDLENLSEEKWGYVVKTKTIFARVTPEQKLKVVDILKKQNETVAVTGDGVNDVLALKRADIGISMGIRGSDVARDSSDMVLLDDNFASIIKAIRQGRRVFDNMKKSIKFLLSVNVANLFVIMIALLMGLPLPFLPLALLWMNLVTDSLPALALSVEPLDKKVMKRKPENKALLSGIWPDILFAGFVNFVTVMIIFDLMSLDYTLEVARTAAVTVSIFQAIILAFAFKSGETIFRKNIFDNKWLIYACMFSIGIHLLAIYTLLGIPFGFVHLNGIQILWCIGFAIGGVLVVEIWKFWRRALDKK